MSLRRERQHVAPRRQHDAGRGVAALERIRHEHAVYLDRETTAAAAARHRADDDRATGDATLDEPCQQRVARAAEAEIDDVGLGVDRGCQSLREREAVADCRRRRDVGMPARLEHEQFHVGRDADDADAVVRHGADDTGDGGTVGIGPELGRVGIDEVATRGRVRLEVRMIYVGAGIDDGNAHAAAATECLGIEDRHLRHVLLQLCIRIVVRVRLGIK